MNFNPVISSKPVGVVVWSWIFILCGVGTLVEFLIGGFLGGFAVNYIGLHNTILFLLQSLLPAGGIPFARFWIEKDEALGSLHTRHHICVNYIFNL